MTFGSMTAISVAILFSAQTGRSQDGQQKVFPTANAALKALVSAARSNDVSALLEILGPEGKELVSSGDDIADKNDRATFVQSYNQQHKLVATEPGTYVLQVGVPDWPLPIPLVKKKEGWVFDTAAGKQEELYRRIGQNELDAIRVCRAIIQAEHEYAKQGHDGDPPGSYTRRIRSEEGKQNGLYWEAKEGEPTSPAGPLLAAASEEGYEKAVSRRIPFHGYLYRILSAQGPNAPGGAKEYIANGKMTGGVAILAYPAEYRSSGVMTFMVSLREIVYQKDLGSGTDETAKAITAFDPDSSWQATGEGTKQVKGTATYRERMALPPNAVFEATLEDVSKADAPAETIARTRIEEPGNPPISFEITYDPSRINAGRRYEVRGRILVDGALFFTTVQHYPVFAAGQSNRVALLMQRASGGVAGAQRGLENTYWKLISLGTAPVTVVSQQAEPHLIFDAKLRRVSGSGGCNGMTGGYEVSGDHLTFGLMANTMMECPQGMDTETAFLKALTQVKTWKIAGQHLDLFDAGGQAVARLEARDTK
jgi:uncharacterized lipoprotein YbaY